jgi:hypothetical protein
VSLDLAILVEALTLDAEADEDKHLDAQHVIEEAMSKPSPFLTNSIPTFPNSTGTHAQLSKMPEMYVTPSSEYISS